MLLQITFAFILHVFLQVLLTHPFVRICDSGIVVYFVPMLVSWKSLGR